MTTKPKHQSKSKLSSNLKSPPVFRLGQMTYLDDLEDMARFAPEGHQGNLSVKASCCGGPVDVFWDRKSGHIIIGCLACKLLLVRLVLARRPLETSAGAAVDGKAAAE